MDELLRDTRYALRALRNSPGFTLVAVTTLALGIGVNTTIFSLVNAVLLRPLPVERPQELVDVYGHAATSSSHDTTSYPDYLDLREQTDTLTGLVAYSNFFASLANDGRSELVVGEVVSDNYFSVLGVQPQIGRAFVPEELVTEGTHPVAILNHGFWQTRFGAAADIVGKDIRLNGIAFTVVGVAPPDFGGMFGALSAQLWIPIAMVEEVEPLGNNRRVSSPTGDTRMTRRGSRWLWLRGRRQADVTVEEVRAELGGIVARLEAEYPETNEFERVSVLATEDVRTHPDFDAALVPAGMLLLGVVGLVLLVACANLANMLLARAAARQREIAIRLAIGAARSRLVRQLLTESLVLSLLGGLAGLAIANAATGLLVRFQPPLPINFSLRIDTDWRVLAFTLAASALTGITFGLMPALRASRPDLVPALKSADAVERRSRRGLHLRDVLVVAQVAISIVLLVAGALMTRSLAVAQQVDLGYDPDRTAFLALPMEMNGYDGEQSTVFFAQARARLEATPGVQDVSLMSRVPLSVNDNNFGLFIDGHQSTSADRPYFTGGSYVDHRYFSTLEIPVLDGRDFEPADRELERRVAIVNQALAARYWPGQGAVGEQFRTSWDANPYEIVGVVRDYKANTPGEEPTPYLHLPYPRQTTFGNFAVHTAGLAAGQLGTLEQAIRDLDPDVVFLDTGTLRTLAEVRLFPVKAAAWLIGSFGLLALALAAVGLSGVIGYSVSGRVREIGIRMALGAETGRVTGLILRQGMMLVAIGGVIGGVIAAAAGSLLSSALFVSSFDVISFGIAFAVLASVAALANWLPARRAARISPMVALRSE